MTTETLLRDALQAIASLEAKTKLDHIGVLKQARHIAKCALAAAETTEHNSEWSGSPCPIDPTNFWIDDETGERVCATTGERTAA